MLARPEILHHSNYAAIHELDRVNALGILFNEFGISFRLFSLPCRPRVAERNIYPVAIQAAEYMEWYLSLPGKMLLLSERDCMYYLYQMHSALGVLESAGSDKAMELTKKLDLYNQMLQNRLYGSVGMDLDDEEEEYEDDDYAAEEELVDEEESEDETL